MLDERTTGRPTTRTGAHDDHSMQLLEYVLAIVAVGAAFLLAFVR